MKRMLAALALAAGAAFTAAAVAQPSPAVTVQICNRSDQDAVAAIAFVPPGRADFTSRGWTHVAAGACQTIATTNNSRFYGYAEAASDGRRYWGGDFTQCVVRTDLIFELTPRAGEDCRRGQEAVGFRAMHADRAGVFTWALDP